MNKGEYVPYLLLWLALAAIPFGLMLFGRRKGVGLVIGYCIQLWMFYWLGAAMHALPWSDLPDDGFVLIGFKESVRGFAGFVIGSVLIAPFVVRAMRLRSRPQKRSSVNLALSYLLVGGVLALLGRLVLDRIPSMTALTSAGQQFALAGVCIGCWQARVSGHQWRIAKWLIPVALMPFATVVGQGFLGFGTLALIAVLCFVAQSFRPRWLLVPLLFALAYVGLSFYAAYMRDRLLIRQTVWTGQPLSARLSRLGDTIQRVRPFSIKDTSDLETVDDRLNQNMLVGAAVVTLSASQEYAKGGTLWMAIAAMVPRALWPDKPVIGGSGDLVTRFTGITFAEGTSIGIGPVLELYANFGSPGEFFGFILLGTIVGFADITAARYLEAAEWQQFAIWFAGGLAFLQVSGSLAEVTSSAVAAIVLGRFLMRFFSARSRNMADTRAWAPSHSSA